MTSLESGHIERIYPSPFPKLNAYLAGGFRGGELVYIGARPGQGKSALATQCACEIAKRGTEVLVVSREMKQETLARRLMAQEGRLDAGGLRRGERTEHAKLVATLNRIYEWPVWMTDRAASIGDIVACLAARPTLRCLIVDYLQLLTPSNPLHDRRRQVEALSGALKGIAMEHDIPVIVLSSLARPPTQNEDHVPTLAALKESSNLEHDCDVALFLHRPKRADFVELIVAKNREGARGIIQLRFDERSVRFDELTGEQEPWENECVSREGR